MSQVDSNLFALAFKACAEPLVLLDVGGAPVAASAGVVQRLGLDVRELQECWPELCAYSAGGVLDVKGLCHCVGNLPKCGPVEITCAPVKDEHGRLMGGVVHLRRQQRQQEEQEGRAADKVLERASAVETRASRMGAIRAEALVRLAGGIAHNFNNALAGVIGVASLARLNHADDAELVHDLDDIIAQARRMAEWTRHLLAYAHQGPFHPTVCDLNETIENAVSIIRPSVSHPFQIVFEGGENLPPVKADVSLIQELCEEIVTNASEACGGRGTIRIRTERDGGPERKSSTGAPWVRISFQDDGPGMDETTVARIFDPFFSTRFPGRGMGLTVVRSIVESHGGMIAVQTELGVGTRFDVWLPGLAEGDLDAVAVGTEEAPAPAATESPERAPRLGPVLIIDDEPIITDMVGQFLLREGVDVIVANSGEEALRKADECDGGIRLVLMDVVLPGLSGPDLVDSLRERGVDAPVLICSAYDESNPTVAAMIEHGAEGLLQKPFDVAMLAGQIRRRLSSGT